MDPRTTILLKEWETRYNSLVTMQAQFVAYIGVGVAIWTAFFIYFPKTPSSGTPVSLGWIVLVLGFCFLIGNLFGVLLVRQLGGRLRELQHLLGMETVERIWSKKPGRPSPVFNAALPLELALWVAALGAIVVEAIGLLVI
jgi:hypothetical protein